MAFKGFFNKITSEIGNEITKQLSGGGGGGASSGEGGHGGGGGGASSGEGGHGGGFNMALLENVVGLIGKHTGRGESSSGGGGGSGGRSGIQKMLGAIQKYGGILPGDVAGKYLPTILKMAEIFGHGLGDDTPRTETNPDGSIIDDFLKTLISGRKIFGGGGGKTIKETAKGGGGSGSGDGKYVPSYDETEGGGASGSSGAQDFEELKSACLASGELFEDDLFPPADSSVFYSNSSRRKVYWKRPHEIDSNPQFFVDGASRFDVKQGELGDCWLLAAVANLTLNETTFRSVVPGDNSFADGEYAGIFHFRFWQYGKWIDIVIDDKLPCDSSGQLLFMHSEDNGEFWSALLEKAYAKMYGSYEALKGGTTCEALVDFTGGVTELYDIESGPKNLFQLLEKAWERLSFMGCSIEPDPHIVEAATPQGLYRGHAYSITDIRRIEIESPSASGTIPLLRIRNPWGNEGEWKGAWADCSPEWQFVQEETKEEIGLTFDADGEFWMSYKDFLSYFQRVEICNLSPDSLEEDMTGNDRRKWEMSIYEGVWKEGVSAGGCRNYLETFAKNPQYIIRLDDPDEDDDDNKCTVIVGLMQKNRRAMRASGMECLTIGFAIYRLNGSEPSPLPTEFFKYNASAARSPTFINLREVSSRFKLPPGTYCIVPSTFEPGQEAEFIIRVFSETANHMQENQ